MDTDRSAVNRHFDMDAAWTVHPQVAVRPESFGALLYHFGTRRLSFLKDPRLVAVLRELAEQPSAAAACSAVGIEPAELKPYQEALTVLSMSHMIAERAAPVGARDGCTANGRGSHASD
ncbi:mycofactocin biosynthesis chaperone MftB [Streptomyces sp. CA-106131]|uniref:mycofactocin biosynthesis chaperone MftB n=1 Tax=Streptomyces sp. CA-106131 TaxID=3240045 RepID=UPI003D8B2E18